MNNRSAINLDAMLEKRRETVGEKDRFEIILKDTSFWMVAPELASEEWNDRFTELQEDADENVIGRDDFKKEFFDLFFAEQADDFVEMSRTVGVDAFHLASWALQKHMDEVGKIQSRDSSRNGQRRSNRR